MWSFLFISPWVPAAHHPVPDISHQPLPQAGARREPGPSQLTPVRALFLMCVIRRRKAHGPRPFLEPWQAFPVGSRLGWVRSRGMGTANEGLGKGGIQKRPASWAPQQLGAFMGLPINF